MTHEPPAFRQVYLPSQQNILASTSRRKLNALKVTMDTDNGYGVRSPQETRFLTKCTNYLLSDRVISDQKISQVEATNFLISYSIEEAGICSGRPQDRCSGLTYNSLDIQIQLAFLWSVCPIDSVNEGPADCFTRLQTQGDEFGWILTGTDFNRELVTKSVDQYCHKLWELGTDFHGGIEISSSPTSAVSNIPTVPPSKPYQGETLEPSIEPTGKGSKINETSILGNSNSNDLDMNQSVQTIRVIGILLLFGVIIFMIILCKAISRRNADMARNFPDLSSPGVDAMLQVGSERIRETPHDCWLSMDIGGNDPMDSGGSDLSSNSHRSFLIKRREGQPRIESLSQSQFSTPSFDEILSPSLGPSLIGSSDISSVSVSDLDHFPSATPE